MQKLSWQLFAGYINCDNPVFCAQPFDKAVGNFEKSIYELDHAYELAMDVMQGYPTVIDVFTRSQCFNTPNGLYRCITKDSDFMPENWVSKTYNGYGNLVQNFIRSSRKYFKKVLELYEQNKNVSDVRKVDSRSVEPDFHFMYEIPLLEGEAGAYQAINNAKDTLSDKINNGVLSANISYAVGLACSFMIFIWIFGSIRKRILEETRYSRGGKIDDELKLVLYMVPYDTLRNTKAMIEYIENLHAAIAGQ